MRCPFFPPSVARIVGQVGGLAGQQRDPDALIDGPAENIHAVRIGHVVGEDRSRRVARRHIGHAVEGLADPCSNGIAAVCCAAGERNLDISLRGHRQHVEFGKRFESRRTGNRSARGKRDRGGDRRDRKIPRASRWPPRPAATAGRAASGKPAAAARESGWRGKESNRPARRTARSACGPDRRAAGWSIPAYAPECWPAYPAPGRCMSGRRELGVSVAQFYPPCIVTPICCGALVRSKR